MFSLKLTVTIAVIACCLSCLLLATTCLAKTHVAAAGLDGNLNGITFDDKARAAARRLAAANSKCCRSTACRYGVVSTTRGRTFISTYSKSIITTNGATVNCGPPCGIITDSIPGPYSPVPVWIGIWGTQICIPRATLGHSKDCRVRSPKYNLPNLPNNGYNYCVCVFDFGFPERCTTKCVRPNVAQKLKDSTGEIAQDLAAKLDLTVDSNSTRLTIRAFPGSCA